MNIQDRRYEFGQLVKGFREELGLNITEFSKFMKIQRSQVYLLERGDRPFIEINTLLLLMDLGLPIHMLKDDSTRRDIEERLRIHKFKNQLNHHKNKKLRFDFEMFCELNKEEIEENYIPDVLEVFK